MQLSAHNIPLAEVQADWLLVTAWEEEAPSGPLAQLDGHLSGPVSRLYQSGDVRGKTLELTPLLDCRGIAAKRVLVVGQGKRDQADRAALTDAAAAAARAVTGKEHSRIALALPEDVPALTGADVAR